MKLASLAFLGVLGLATTLAADPKPKPKLATTFAVTKIDPAKGDAEGGTYVRVVGVGFLTDDKGKPAPAPNAKVYFGKRQGEIIRFASDTELIAQAPGGTVGDVVDVLVIFEGRGENKLAKAFTFITKD